MKILHKHLFEAMFKMCSTTIKVGGRELIIQTQKYLSFLSQNKQAGPRIQFEARKVAGSASKTV